MENKKILIVCTTDSMIWNFLTPHIDYLVNRGHDVECACSRTGFYFDELTDSGYILHEVDFQRSPFRIKNISAFFTLRKLIKAYDYDIIQCHEPVGGAIGRLAGRSCGKYVMYFAHGFHFFDGAPLKHWMLYYSFEYILSYFTDAIITICKEDFERSKKFHAKNCYYIHGIGIDYSKYDITNPKQNRKQIRQNIGVKNQEIVLITVGEMIRRKNHRIILEAMSAINRHDIHLIICGDGELKDYLFKLSKELGISDKVHFLGFRRDIPNVLCAADAFIFPSLWEGLGLAGLEAMYMGIPVIGSRRQGIKDYVLDNNTGLLFDPQDKYELVSCIESIFQNPKSNSKFSENGKNIALKYSIENSVNDIEKIYIKEGII